jgi:hypothetical protein
MVAWVFESNLMWSSRLVQSFRGLGHSATVEKAVPAGDADIAVVNLADPEVSTLVETLKTRGVYVIAHAGHKEKDLLELGRGLAVDRLATNGELTFKLPNILSAVSEKNS